MRTEEEIRKQLEHNSVKIYPKGEYWIGAKDGYLNALKWVLE